MFKLMFNSLKFLVSLVYESIRGGRNPYLIKRPISYLEKSILSIIKSFFLSLIEILSISSLMLFNSKL